MALVTCNTIGEALTNWALNAGPLAKAALCDALACEAEEYAALAGVNLAAHRLVVLDATEYFIYADNSLLDHAHKLFGMTVGAVTAGNEVLVRRTGAFVDGAWNWTLNQPIFVGANGNLTQVPPVAGFSLIVGFPESPTKIMLDFGVPIIL